MLLLDSLDAWALFGLRLLTQGLECLLHVLYVLACLFEMVSESLGEFLVGSLLLKLGKSLHQSPLGVQNVAELVQEQFARIIHLCSTHHFSSYGIRGKASCERASGLPTARPLLEQLLVARDWASAG